MKRSFDILLLTQFTLNILLFDVIVQLTEWLMPLLTKGVLFDIILHFNLLSYVFYIELPMRWIECNSFIHIKFIQVYHHHHVHLYCLCLCGMLITSNQEWFFCFLFYIDIKNKNPNLNKKLNPKFCFQIINLFSKICSNSLNLF